MTFTQDLPGGFARGYLGHRCHPGKGPPVVDHSSTHHVSWRRAATRRGGSTNGQVLVGLYRDDTLKPHAWIDDADGFAGLLKTQGITGGFYG